MEKSGRTKQANIIQSMCFTNWITKHPPPPSQTHTCTEKMQYLLLFHGYNSYTNVPECYVIHKFPALFYMAQVENQ